VIGGKKHNQPKKNVVEERCRDSTSICSGTITERSENLENFLSGLNLDARMVWV
jgi:hypothetical protein